MKTVFLLLALTPVVSQKEGCDQVPCEQRVEICKLEAEAKAKVWLDSLEDQFSYCAAQADGDYPILIECLGGLPKVDLSCFDTVCHEPS